MTHEQIGQAVKHFHPGVYDQHDDATLGQAVARKYPHIYGPQATQANPDSDTVPETPKTLRLQLEQLQQGKRRAVFVPRGSKVKIDAKQYGAAHLRVPAGDVYYNRKLIQPREILEAFQNHELNEILGDAQLGYGAPAKQDLQPPVQAVVARDSEGETVHGALTDQQNEPAALAAAESLKPEGGTVSVESPAKEIKHRKKAGARWPKPGGIPSVQSQIDKEKNL